jgi:hypothetical protein
MRRPVSLNAEESLMMKFSVAAALIAAGLAVIAAPVSAQDYRRSDCVDCKAPRQYDSREVIKTTRDVDHSRVINTTKVVPASRDYGRRDRYRRRAAEHRTPYRAAKRRPAATCKDCAPRRKYDSREVVRTTRDIDHSRVIDTQSVVPVSRRVVTKNHLVIHDKKTRHVGTVRHNHTIIEKEVRYVRPVVTTVNFVVRHYRVVERPDSYVVVPAPRRKAYDCTRRGRYGRHASCRSVVRVRG